MKCIGFAHAYQEESAPDLSHLSSKLWIAVAPRFSPAAIWRSSRLLFGADKTSGVAPLLVQLDSYSRRTSSAQASAEEQVVLVDLFQLESVTIGIMNVKIGWQGQYCLADALFLFVLVSAILIFDLKERLRNEIFR